MANIFINGINSKVGGGKSILNSFLENISGNNNIYYLLAPDESYKCYNSININVITISPFFTNGYVYPIINKYILPYFFKKYIIEVIINFSDIPTLNKKSIKQLLYFDWAYAVYPESIVWERMTKREYIYRKIKLFYFKKYFHNIDHVIVQTEVIKERLKSIYNFLNITTIPNAVSLNNYKNEKTKKYKLPFDKWKLLYLSYYYTHKNLEILIPLAIEIKKRKLDFVIITTIESKQHKYAKAFINNIKRYDLDSVIINVGPVEQIDIATIYNSCNALLMPSLLESFSGTYIEAMFHKLPILTSNLDFAKIVCGNCAAYFDPLSIESILKTIMQVYNNEKIKAEMIMEGERIVNNIPKWSQVNLILDNIIQNMKS